MKKLNSPIYISKLLALINWKKTFLSSNRLNRYKLLKSYLNHNPKVEGLPSLLHIEITNRCNLSCVMCGRNTKKFSGNSDISFDLFKKIVDQALSMKVEMLILHSWGEPLLHPQIIEMIEYADLKCIPTWMSTNATLLDEKMSKRILRSGLRGLVFSIDGATAKTYESIRKGANYKVTVNNIKRFLKLRKEMNVKIMNTIQMIKMEENKHEVTDFIKIWSPYDINILIKPLVDWHGTNIDPNRPANFICDKPWFWMKIQSSGSVVPCGHFSREEHMLGNASQDKLINIWKNSSYTKFRTKMCKSWRNIDVCSTCKYKPPRPHNFMNNLAFISLDLFSLTKILFTIGYKKDVQTKT